MGWLCLPAAGLLAVALLFGVARLGRRAAMIVRTALVALLLPGLVLAFEPELASAHGVAAAMLCRAAGTLPVLVLPALWALSRMPAGQHRAAIGLGAGRAARFRLLWLPQMGPACVAGLCLAGIVDGAALLKAPHHRATLLSAPAPAS